MLGGMYAAQGEGTRGARIWGVAERLRKDIHCPLPLLVEQEYQRYLTALRAPYDPVMWEAAWAAGRAMPLDQAVAHALEVDEITL